jgi:hypothetical protein
MSYADEPTGHSSDFSLVLGGPVFQFLRRARLTDDALTLLRRRVLAIAAITWLPLLALSAVGGRLLGGNAAVPFLMDVDVQIKFLLVVPLLIVAELVVHRRLSPLVNQFLEQGLLPDTARAGFDAVLASAARLRNSVLAEVLLFAVVYGFGVPVIWRHYAALNTTTWYATPSSGGSALSLVGWWYGLVSLPLLQFLVLRWLFRLSIWAVIDLRSSSSVMLRYRCVCLMSAWPSTSWIVEPDSRGEPMALSRCRAPGTAR